MSSRPLRSAASSSSTRSTSLALPSALSSPTSLSKTTVMAWFDCALELVRQFGSSGLVLLDNAYGALEFFTQKKHFEGYFPAIVRCRQRRESKSKEASVKGVFEMVKLMEHVYKNIGKHVVVVMEEAEKEGKEAEESRKEDEKKEEGGA
ncbi:hypothetical protein Fmac_021267 [Flemingia macrophylla]|uniref:Uncharacterized protein n=1 Tax=Flemingia macrophylla TaxID=520843 RepID=A0ABD1LWD2_9FABA